MDEGKNEIGKEWLCDSDAEGPKGSPICWGPIARSVTPAPHPLWSGIALILLNLIPPGKFNTNGTPRQNQDIGLQIIPIDQQ